MKKKKQIKKIKHHSKNSKPIGKVAKLSIDNNILTVKYKYNEEYQKTILIATCPICNIKLNVNKDGIIKYSLVKCFNCGKDITPIFSFKSEPFKKKDAFDYLESPEYLKKKNEARKKDMQKRAKHTTSSFITAINNGWLHNANSSVSKVFEYVNNAILNKKVQTVSFNICHAKEVKEYIEKTTSGCIEIFILEDIACPSVQCIIHIDYDELSIADFHELKQTIKKYK